jgi:tRNA(Ile)-lysidine synthase
MTRAVFHSTILQHDMLREGDGVVAALSGGPDSTALLCLLIGVSRELRLRIHGAHFNHGLRGSEADEDEAFVRLQCKRLEVPFTSARAGQPPGKGENMEQWAREARYRFLEEVRDELGFRRIALGHNRDDLAETLLMRLIRGSGLSGLACLRPVREDGMIRPMLGLSRADVLLFLEELGESYREDSSNRDLRRLRNRVRHELIPLLERKYNPRIGERLARTAGLVQDDEDQLELAASVELSRLLAEGEGPVEMSCRRLLDLPAALARRVVRGALHRSLGHLRSVDRSHVEAVLDLASGAAGEKSLDLPGDVRALVSYDRLIFETGPAMGAPDPWQRPLAIPGRTTIEECGLEAVVSLGSGPEILAGQVAEWPDVSTTVLLDGTAVGEVGLVLRSCRPGDRYCPAGAPGSRKVSRMLIDDQVPRHRRWRVPLLAAGDQPIWLPGHRPEARWGWQAGSGAACLRLELRPAGSCEGE